MSTRPPDLPEFDRPPVVEVVLAVKFLPPEGLRTTHLGVFWAENFATELPTVEELAAYDAPVERFDGVEPGVQFNVMTGPPPTRFWFISPDDSRLLQLQRDWFARNWRKTNEVDEYPRYESIRDAFAADLTLFSNFIEGESLGELRFEQCEVTYINHVVPNAHWSAHGDVGQVLSNFKFGRAGSNLPQPEDAQLAWRYLISGETGTPVGRLHVNVQPGYSQVNRSPILRMSLTARGKPAGSGLDALVGFLDTGRERIVRAFANLTTDEMHQEWGRTR